jgi:hypothetical protein
MAAPIFVHVVPINEGPIPTPHQDSVGCWCGPIYAIDIRSTLGRADVRVMLHRTPGSPSIDRTLGLYARKGDVVQL